MTETIDLRIFRHGTRDLRYLFTPADDARAPLVVILHGHTPNPVPSRYRSPAWNVLCPLDEFGQGGAGSWWLGEAGDHFWLDAMPALISRLYEGDRLFFCGSSMGGYGAILHGVLNRARAVYANIPQTRLLGSSYSEDGMKVFFEPIFRKAIPTIYNDLRDVLSDDLPTSFLLSGIRWDKRFYIEEQTLPFLEALCARRINFQSEIRFGEGHALTHSIAEAVALFDKNMRGIEENYRKKSAGSASRPMLAVRAAAADLRLVRHYVRPVSEGLQAAARDIINRHAITVGNHHDIPVGPKFWMSGNSESRVWQFALHSFGVLDPLLSTGAVNEARALIEEWAKDYAGTEPDAPNGFPWHDHATALRLDRLSALRMLGAPGLQALAETHARLLLRESFYSRGTNHGYDQALSLLLASLVFADRCDTAEWRRIGSERLVEELRFAFNPEGVHVENSPAYHIGMTANLVRARLLVEALKLDLDFDFDGLLNQALRFTSWIVGPDRHVALLGDSTERGALPPPELAHLPSYQNALYATSGGKEGVAPVETFAIYPDAGYAIYRSAWLPWSDHTHLVMKCGFLSSYHRQDDDLNILLQAYGEHWLIDSGLYNHNPDDPVRIYMRSAMAHNVPYIHGRSIGRRVPVGAQAPTLSKIDLPDGRFAFRGVTNMYQSAQVSRTVTVQGPDQFQIVDRFVHGENDPGSYVLFHTPMNKRVRTSPHVARVTGKRREMVIRVADGEVENCIVHSGLGGMFQSVASPQINVKEDSQVIVFGPVRGWRIRFSLAFEHI